MLYLQVMTWKNVELKLSDIRPKGRRSHYTSWFLCMYLDFISTQGVWDINVGTGNCCT